MGGWGMRWEGGASGEWVEHQMGGWSIRWEGGA